MGSYVAPLVVEGAEHACAAVGGGAAAEAYDETAGTVAVGMEHLFAYAPRGGAHGVALLRLNELQSDGLCHLYDGCVGGHGVGTAYGAHEGIVGCHVDHVGTEGVGEGAEHAFPSVAHLKGYDLGRCGGAGCGVCGESI